MKAKNISKNATTLDECHHLFFFFIALNFFISLLCADCGTRRKYKRMPYQRNRWASTIFYVYCSAFIQLCVTIFDIVMSVLKLFPPTWEVVNHSLIRNSCRTCNLSLISLESYLVMYIFMICSSINTSVIWVFVDVEQQLWFVLSQMVEIEVSDLKVEDVQTWQDICVLYVMTEILSSLLHRWL